MLARGLGGTALGVALPIVGIPLLVVFAILALRRGERGPAAIFVALALLLVAFFVAAGVGGLDDGTIAGRGLLSAS